ncbi:hypothetical protein FHG87_000781 [Trinorchestia longiramus]|nr:hypothetical protein FHG87_000781 [Trinorchestia longiramus]
MSSEQDKIWLEGDIKGEYHFLKEFDHPLSEIINPVHSSEKELKFSEASVSPQEDDRNVSVDEIFDSNYVDYSFGEEQDVAAFDLNTYDEQDANRLWGESDLRFSDEITAHTSEKLGSISQPKNFDSGQSYQKPFHRDFQRSIKDTDSALKKRYSDNYSPPIYEIKYEGSANKEKNSHGFSSFSPHRYSERLDPNRFPLPEDYVRNIINRKEYQDTEHAHQSKNQFQTSGKTRTNSERQSLVALPLQSGNHHGRKKPPSLRGKSTPGASVNRNHPVTIIINRGLSTNAPKSRPIPVSLAGGHRDTRVVPIARKPLPPRYNQKHYKIFKIPVIDRTAIILFLVFIATLSVGPLIQILFAPNQGKKRNKDAKASLTHREDDEGSPILELHRQVQSALDIGEELYGGQLRGVTETDDAGASPSRE